MKSLVGLPLLLLLLLLTNCNWQPAQAKNILCIVGTPQHENPGWTQLLFEALAGRGHSLTLLSTAPNPVLEGIYYESLHNAYDVVPKHFVDANGSYHQQWEIKQLLIWYESLLGSCRSLLENRPDKLRDEYDVILYDASYAMDCLLQQLPEFRTTPVLGLSGGKLTRDLLQVVRAENTISIPRVPHFMSTLSQEMSYWERIQNHIMYMAERFIRWAVIMPVLEGMLQQGYRKPDVQLMLLNTHPVLDYVQNMPPNVIEVGGLHIRAESTPLPLSLQDFVDRYTEGIVYINLPHIELLQELGIDTVTTMIQEFGQFGFIWNQKNVKLPQHLINLRLVDVDASMQQDILGERRSIMSIRSIYIYSLYICLDLAISHIKAFLTHGDSFGLQEAIYNAVPTIVFPMILEQLNNAKRIEERFLGIHIPVAELSTRSFSEALKCLLRDENYVGALQQAQFNFRTRQVKPLDQAVWYVEQLAADPQLFKHLQHPETRETNYLVSHSLDVIIWPFLFVVLFVCNIVVLLLV
ncbi:hypothetical protein KR222_008774, partial [Zaprionus bogoriensis]